MKVLAISYKAEISGGSNRSFLSIIDLLLEKKIDVILVLPKKNGKMYEEAKKRKIKIIYMPYSRTGKQKSNSKVIQLLQYYYENAKETYNQLITFFLKKRLEKEKIDIVYVNGCAMHAGRFIKRVLNIPHVWHIREYYNDNSIYPKNMYKKIEKYTDKLILISNDLYEEYSKHIDNKKLIMISNGIKYEEMPPKLKHDGINILLVGRITKDKCQMDALKAFKDIIKESKKNIKLLFAGKPVTERDEEYLKELNDYIKNNSISDYVKFLGEVDNLKEIRRKIDIELMCSSREPFGRVTVEAMRSGIAVIGANSGGTKDIIVNKKNGLLYEPNNIIELKKCMKELIDNDQKREKLSQNAKIFSKNNFTENQLLKTVNLIKDIAEGSEK